MVETRRLAAIMFADMAGYTAATQSDEAGTLNLVREQEELVRPLLAIHKGRVVKSTGDGFLAEFDSALRAVQCAIDIQQHLHERNARPGIRPIPLRIGVHLGDVEQRGTDIFGDAVNIASRVEPLADPGGVCLSEPVFVQVRNQVPYQMEKLGPKNLKGIREPMEVYRVLVRTDVTHPEPSTRLRASHRLAVLPFVNMSPDANDEYFADGLTEELIGTLSEIRDLKVIARTSVMSYKRKEKRLVDIAKELGVDSVIEGSVRRSGNRIRVRVQLVDGETEEQRWASNYDVELNDVFAIQTDVASKVAGALARGVLLKGSKKEIEDAEAYTCYLRGLQLLHEGTSTSLRRAVALFDRAIKREPAFARAYAALSRAWSVLASESWEEWEVIGQRAEPAARRALELDPESAEAHAAMADVHGLLDRFSESIAEAEKAIEINPNLAECYETLGRQRSSLGALDQGLMAYRRAYELNPLAVRVGVDLAWVAQLSGREDEALNLLTTLHQLDPEDPRIWDGLAEYHRLKGDLSMAEKLLREGLATHPHDGSLQADLAVVYALTAKRREAEEALRAAERDANETGKNLARLYVHAALGNLDPAFEALTRLGKTHAWPFLIEAYPLFRQLREDPRYSRFRTAVGLRPPT